MTLKTIVFQIRNFVPFIVWLLSSLVNYWPIMTLLMSKEGFKRGIVSHNLMVLKNSLTSTRKSKLIFDFCHV